MINIDDIDIVAFQNALLKPDKDDIKPLKRQTVNLVFHTNCPTIENLCESNIPTVGQFFETDVHILKKEVKCPKCQDIVTGAIVRMKWLQRRTERLK